MNIKTAGILLGAILAAVLLSEELYPLEKRTRVFSISGSVDRPLVLSVDDLNKFRQAGVRLNEVGTDGNYTGAFFYEGVPLKNLLEIARVKKNENTFSKFADMAVIVKNRDGGKTVLSWGEVAYGNPADCIVAVSARPLMPMKDCLSCHKNDGYRKYHEPLGRQVRLPRLVLAGDFYADRCMEDVTDIEIVDLFKKGEAKKDAPVFSSRIEIRSGADRTVVVEDLKKYGLTEIRAKQSGDGRGYHGLLKAEGARLKDILKKEKINPGLDCLFVFTAPDGYRSVFSAGEILLSSKGEGIFIADLDGSGGKKKTGLSLVSTADLSADRWVSAVDKIEIRRYSTKPRLYIIGVGCGDSELLTLDAVSYISRSDSVVCSADIQKRFSSYIGDKPILFDPLLNIPHYYKKMNPGMTMEEVKKKVRIQSAKQIETIKAELAGGRSVGFLEYGDPTIYGSWTYWLLSNFAREDYEVVPGISSFNAANAMIGRNITSNGSAVLTVPDGIKNNEDLVRAAAGKGETLVMFIGLTELKNLMPVLEKYYRKNTPVAVVYSAGYKKYGRMIKTDLSGVLGIVESDREKFLGLIYIGDLLK